MATRSAIIQKLENGKFRGVYCHWDGYLNNNGRILFNHYKDYKKVTRLIELGSISSLNNEVDVPHGVMHSYDSPNSEITVAYHRDRGEDWDDTSYTEKDSLKEVIECIDNYYNYLFINDEWHVNSDVCENINDSDLIEFEGMTFVKLSSIESKLNRE